MRLEVPEWTLDQIIAVAQSSHVFLEREADFTPAASPTDVSFHVEAQSRFEVKERIREVLGEVPEEAFTICTV
jgi:hypothetical protein